MLYEFNPKRSLGQNFLVNPHILDKITSAAEISKNDIILEVGPGTGNLTKKLVEKAGKVIAVEKDRRLIEPLKEMFKSYPGFEVVEGDILKFDVTCYMLHEFGYKIVANIPYYITSILLRKIFEEWPRPELIILTIQKEVAQRMMVKPPHMNLLALSVQYYAKPEIVGYISKNNFRPIPKVDSAIIKLRPKQFPGFPEARLLETQENMRLFELIRAGFSEKRKQLASILSKKMGLEKEKILDAFQKTGINLNARAENLSLEQWQKLVDFV